MWQAGTGKFLYLNKHFSKAAGVLLPDLDSNQDKQNQNLLYYRYTIGQSGGKKSRKINFSFYVGLLGFEPRQTESKSVVLPLHNNPIGPIFIWDGKSKGYQ